MSRAVLDSLAAHTCVLDAGGRVIAVNRAWERFSAEHPEDRWRPPLGTDYLAVCEEAAKEGSVQAPLVADGVRGVLAGRQRALHLDYADVVDDEELWFSMRVSPLDVAAGGAVISYTDITTRKRAETQLAHQALHDPLTVLPNRTLFMDRLSLALARLERRSTTVAVLFLDLDRFKMVNDNLGHDVGDQLIIAMAGRLRSVLRPGDTAARFGGDEFTVLCEEIVGAADAVAIADRILAAAARPFQLEDTEICLSTSVGIALATSPDDRPEGLVRDADAAMYQAKQRGKARWVLFDEDMRASAVARLEVENGLHRALDREELRIRYQPIVQPATGAVIALEARAWWDSANLGMLSPDEWQPLAEEVGLAVPIGTWVLQAACRQAATWAGDIGVGVDLSARQLAQPDTVAVVQAALDVAGLPPHRLFVEIAEDALLVDQEHAVDCLTRLREAGVRVGLDRFGSGHSSLVQLRDFPLDALRIDRTFVDDPTVMAALVRLAHSLGLQAVIDGVDTDEQRKAVESAGCDAAQGAAFGEPLPAEEIADLLL